ncbi:MAG: endonuclease III [Candidatus Lokiarchaeota archaeon]|nr:endonuclease III [Candidatus Lokiarchaeota archaeon]MCK4479504.1 endonuclease III [Candidatus Lokiarchaeota archaeon]
MEFSEIFDKIEEQIEGEAHLDELARKKQDPFKILISTILSARTRDANTRIATEKLFAKFSTPKTIAEANLDEIELLIKSSGFYKVKAARIKDVSRILVERYNSNVPDNYKELISLPGVGSKTANCVLVYAYKVPAIPVDVHVHRISNRLGWVKTKTPPKTEVALKNTIPKELWLKLNRLIVRFGQQICISIKPKCESCSINNICPKDFSMELAIKKKKKIKVLL